MKVQIKFDVYVNESVSVTVGCQLGEAASDLRFCLRSSFMLKLRAELLMLSHESVITSNCFTSSFGYGYSCILIILRMQCGRDFESFYPAFISFMESPTTIKFMIWSVPILKRSCSCINFLIFHCEGGSIG